MEPPLGRRDAILIHAHRNLEPQRTLGERHREFVQALGCDILLDETPGAYKNVESFIEAQTNLVEVVARLTTLMCVKG